jgi:hypothetical protein
LPGCHLIRVFLSVLKSFNHMTWQIAQSLFEDISIAVAADGITRKVKNADIHKYIGVLIIELYCI